MSGTLSTALPIALAIVMFGLGLSLQVADFTRAFVRPKAMAIALGCQLVILPLLCLLLVWASGLTRGSDDQRLLALGMILLAASPGGVAASLFSHLFRGDLALNITLLAINSVIAVVTLPLMFNFAASRLAPDIEGIRLPLADVIRVFAFVLVPVAIGMIARARAPRFAQKMDRTVRIGSVVILLAIIAVAFVQGWSQLKDYLPQIGLLSAVFCLVNLIVGYVVPRRFGVARDQSIAISMEIGVHNETLVLTVALGILAQPLLAAPAAVYAILKYVLVPAFGYVITRRTDSRTESIPLTA